MPRGTVNLDNPVKRAIWQQGRRFSYLADRLGVPSHHLSRQLDGKVPLSEEHARLLADITGLPLEMFPVRPVKRYGYTQLGRRRKKVDKEDEAHEEVTA